MCRLFLSQQMCVYHLRCQTPLDFVLRGVLDPEGEAGEPEEVGLELIPNYILKIFRLQNLHSALGHCGMSICVVECRQSA